MEPASIDHVLLAGLLARRLKDRPLLALLGRIIAAALGITLHADAVTWRRAQLGRVPLVPALAAL